MKKLLLAICCFPLLAFAHPNVHLDKLPESTKDKTVLQNGARTFANYCVSCHAVSSLRANRLRDIGFTDEQLKNELNLTAGGAGDLVRIAMRPIDAKMAFGAAPPDLSLIARAKAGKSGSGPDWLYTYMRGFYRDDSRPSGWNNALAENTAMPHVLADLQGTQVKGANTVLTPKEPGKLSTAEYDALVADLVCFLQYVSEPEAEFRRELGIYVLIFLAVLFGLAYALKRSYWKEVH